MLEHTRDVTLSEISNLSQRELDYLPNESSKWGTALALGDEARDVVKNYSLDYYLDELSQLRENTLTYLKSKKDSWLFEENKWGNGISYNNYYLWFHVMEDEINHRGQIRTIKRMLENNK